MKLHLRTYAKCLSPQCAVRPEGVKGVPMRLVTRLRVAVSAIVALTAGCVAGNSRIRPPILAIGEARITLSEEGIARSGISNAYEAIERSRAEQAVTRARGAGTEERIYLDGARLVGTEALHRIPATNIRCVLWLPPREATLRFGNGHSSGAFVIVTKSWR